MRTLIFPPILTYELSVGLNIRPFSWRKHDRYANRPYQELRIMGCQNSLVALLHRFMSILRFFEDCNSVMQYDHSENRNLFEFRKPS